MSHKFPEPLIKIIPDKQLAGKRVTTSLVNNRTGELWKSFMPLRGTISGAVGAEMYSLQVYPDDYFQSFDPAKQFEKWAAIEVASDEEQPAGLELFLLQGGSYAVFYYKGSSLDHRIFGHIYQEWLPASGYGLDSRPHFEVLGDKYRNADVESEEEIWIPVKPL
jgi:AraC family transcriptional regulator